MFTPRLVVKLHQSWLVFDPAADVMIDTVPVSDAVMINGVPVAVYSTITSVATVEYNTGWVNRCGQCSIFGTYTLLTKSPAWKCLSQ